MMFRTAVYLLFAQFSFPVFGLGYDFGHCAEAVRTLSESVDRNPGNTSEEKRRFADRQARLRIVQSEETGRAYESARVLLEFNETYARKVSTLVRASATEGLKKTWIEELANIEKDYLGTKDPELKDDTVTTLLAALTSSGTSEAALNEAIRNYAYEDTIVALDETIGLRRSIRTLSKMSHPASAAPPVALNDVVPRLQDLLPEIRLRAEEGPAARDLARLGPLVYASSAVRKRFHETFVGLAPLDQSFNEILAAGEADRIFRNEVSNLGYEIASNVQKERPDGGLRVFVQEVDVQSQTFLTGTERTALLSKADAAISKRTLPKFFQEELERHVKFLREFNLPIDVPSVHYLNKLSECAEKLGPR